MIGIKNKGLKKVLNQRYQKSEDFVKSRSKMESGFLREVRIKRAVKWHFVARGVEKSKLRPYFLRQIFENLSQMSNFRKF